jgi:hypothetical protein
LPWGCVCTFRLPHALHIRWQFIESSIIANTLLSLRFSILLLLCLISHGVHCQKRTSGTCHFLGSSLVCWSSQKQSSVAQPTTEAEYVAAASCCSQILWTVHTMRDFGVVFERVPLMCDNTSAISVAKNPVFHKKMRHAERRHHFLRDHVEKGDIEMRYIDTERQLADIFTKPLDSSRFAIFWGKIGVCHPYGLI